MNYVKLSKPIEYNWNKPRFMQVKIKQISQWIASWLMDVVLDFHYTCAGILK